MFLSSLRKLLNAVSVDSGKDDITFVAAATTLGVHQQRCIVTTSAAGEFTITLPRSSECSGLMYYVQLELKSTNNTLVAGDGATIATLDTTGDDVLVISVGKKWVPIGGTYT